VIGPAAPAPPTRAVDRRRLCAAGLHADLVAVRVHRPACTLGTCPGSHPGQQCPECGATWDVLTGDRIEATEATS
jgi:hypothetical protein